ncbi:MFS transporter [Schaalia sp. 19OD2882]|nr:MFS transporter [Schaalia sp. 19OD2882]
MVGSVLLITILAFEALATTTVMPNVVADLGAESWFSVASGAALAAQLVTTVVAGALCDWRGARGVLLAGTALFLAGMIVCASAPHVALFVLGRMLQGIGAGLGVVPLYVLVGQVVCDAHRPSFFAAFSMAWVGPSLVGPALAGWVATHLSWRWLFGAVPLVATLAVVPLVRVLALVSRKQGERPRNLMRLALLAMGAGAGVLALQLSGALDGWGAWASLGAALLLIPLTLPSLLPRGALRLAPGVPSLIAARLLLSGAFTGANAALPLLLQRIHSWSAEGASLAVTIASVGWAVGAWVQARVKDPVRREQLPVVGTALMAIGYAPLFLLVWPQLPVWPHLLSVGIATGGLGMAHSTFSVRILAALPQAEHGKGSSWLQVADASGSALELALASILLAAWAHLPVSQGSLAYLPAPVIAAVVGALAILAASRARTAPAQPNGAGHHQW